MAKTRSRKSANYRNTVCYKDMLWNRAYKPLLFHCILLPSFCLLFCQNIHTTVKKGYNHSNLAAQTHLNIHFWVCSVQFHTNKRQHDNSHALKNISRFRNTVQLSANQSSYCAKECLMQIVLAPDSNNIWHR